MAWTKWILPRQNINCFKHLLVIFCWKFHVTVTYFRCRAHPSVRTVTKCIFNSASRIQCNADRTTWKLTPQNINTTPKSFIDPICCNSCMVISMFLRLVLANSLFSHLTWTLAFQKTRGMAWFCGCWEFLVSAYNQSARIFVISVFSDCCAILTSVKKGETAVYGYNLALFWVLSVSCWCLAELIFT